MAAILHGFCLPGAMYLLGDISNLFINQQLSREAFGQVQNDIVSLFGQYNFTDNSNLILTINEAFSIETITPNVVATETNISELTYLASSQSNSSIDNDTIACVIVTHANENIDNLMTPFQVLREISTNQDYTLLVSNSTCNCVLTQIAAINSQAQCYSDHTFFYGLGGVDGIIWTMGLFLLLTVSAFILGNIQIVTMKIACERQIRQMRLDSYLSVLCQDVGWFDLNNAGETAAILNE